MAAKLLLRNLLTAINDLVLPKKVNENNSPDNAELALDLCNSYYIAEARCTGQLPRARKRVNLFLLKTIVIATTFVVASLGFSNNASAFRIVVNSISIGSQSGSSVVTGTAGTATYTITLNEGGAGGTQANDQISLLSWAGGTPTGISSVTFNSGASYNPNSFSTISLSIATTTSTVAGSYTFTIQNIDNNGGGTKTATGTLVINGPISASTGSLSAFTTAFGTPSTSQTFNVSDTYLSNPIIVTPPAGFEVSKDNSTFSSTVSVGTTNSALPSTPVYVRLAAATAVGSYSGNVVLSSTGLSPVNVAIPSSTVAKNNQTITFNPVASKAYGSVDFSPGATASSNLAITYTSDNPAVATIVSNNIHIVGVGTANITAAQPGNGNFNAATSVQQPFTVTAKPITLTANNRTKTYGTTVTFAGTEFTAPGASAGDITGVTLTSAGAASTATVGGTPYTIVPTAATGPRAGNYTITYANGSLTVTTASLTVTGLTGVGKVYDGTVSATAANVTGTAALSGGIVNGDDVSLNTSGPLTYGFSTTLAGANTVNVSGYALSGSTAGNYTLTQPTPLSATITRASLTLTANDGTKTYGTSLGTVTGQNTFTYSGTVNGETIATVSLNYGAGGAATATVAGSPYNTITPSAPVGPGNFSASNYNITTANTGSLTVTTKTLTVSGATTSNKAYDGTTTATITGGSLTAGGVVNGDQVVLSLSGSFASANVGNGIAITSTSTISGTGASNYTLTQPILTSRNISVASLTITGLTANGKVYDATTAATITGTATLNGVAPVDAGSVTLVTGSVTSVFTNTTVGNNKTVNVTGYSITQPASNYTLVQPTALTANITPAPLTIFNADANDKVYDGTTAAVITGSLSGIIGSDIVNLNGTGNFASAQVGTGISVTSTSTLTGNQAVDYSLTQPTGIVADITGGIAESGTLSAFSTAQGTASAAQSFTVSASGSTTGILVTPPTGFEVSSTSGTTGFATTVTLGSGGNLASTTVWVRLASADAAGTYSGNVVLSGTGVNNVNVAATGNVTGSIIESGAITTMNTSFGTPSASLSFTVSDAFLSSGLVVTPPSTSFEVSTDNVSFFSNITLGSTGALANTTVYVRLAAAAPAGNYSGNLVLSTTGQANVNVVIPNSTVSAAGTATIAASGTLTPFSTSTCSASASQTLLISVSSQITRHITVNPPPGYEVSNDGGNTWNGNGNLLSILNGGNGSPTPVLVRLVTGSAINTYAGNIAFATSQAPNASLNVAVTGTVVAGVLSETGTPSAFSANLGFPSASQTISVAGACLTGNVTVTAPTGFEISLSSGSGYAGTLTLTQSGGKVNATSVFIRLSAADASGPYSGNIVLSSTGKANVNVAVSGTMIGGIIESGTLSAFTTSSGTQSASQNFTLSGNALSNDIIVTSPAGYEVSTDNSTFTNAITLTQSGGLVSSTQIYVRLAAADAPGTYPGSVVLSSSPYTNVNINVTGSVVGPIVQNNSFTTFNSNYGTASVSQPFTISDNYIVASVLVTAPAGFEVSTNNSTFSPAVTIGSSGPLSATTVYVRLTSSVAAGTPSGNIVLSTNLATSVNVPVNGNVSGGILETGTLNAFNATQGTPSAAQNFTVSAQGLSQDVIVTPPSGFELSTDNITYQASLDLPISGGSLSSILVYARLAGVDVAGSYAGNIVLTSNGVNSVNVAASGIVAGSQTITFAPTNTVSYGTADYSPGATASSGLTVSYSSSNTAVATIVSGSIHVVGAGSSTITATQAGNANFGAATPVTQTLTVTTKALTVNIGSLAVTSKVYNQSTSATVTGTNGGLQGVLAADAGNVNLNGTPTWVFATSSVGNGKTVSVSGTGYFLTGSAIGNYTLTEPTLTGNITFKTAIISPATGVNKVYDGTTAATITGTVQGVIAGDIVTLIGTGTFASPNVGTNIGITSTSTLGGAQGGNYTITTQPTGIKANITVAPLAITAKNQTKLYGSLFTFAGTEFTNSTLFGTDNITNVIFASPGAAASASVAGSPYAVTPSGATGSGLSNYNISYTNSTLTVNRVPLTITADDKSMLYSAAVPTLTATYTGLVNGETSASLPTKPTITTTATSASLPGTYPIVAANAVDNNYTISYVNGTLTINQVPITFNPIPSQVYGAPDFDPGASAAAAINYTSSDPTVATIVAGNIHIKGVGTSTITATNGSDTKTQTLTVTPAPLNISASVTKTYGTDLTDGAGSTAFTATGLVYGETIASVTVEYDQGAGASDPVSGSPYIGAATPSLATGGTFVANNYNITYTSGNIVVNPALLNVTATGPPKTYGTTLSAGISSTNFTFNGTVNSEAVTSVTLTPDAAGLSNDTPAGSTYSVVPSLATGSGGFLESNYIVTYIPFNGIVNKTALTVSAAGINKVYDGNTNATVNLSDNRVSGDDISTAYASAAFDTKNTGTGKPVSVTGITISGADAGNYTFNSTASTTADITGKVLTVSAAGINKVYDGNTNATVTLSDDKTAGDDVSEAYASAAFDTKNIGTGKPVSVTGITISGADAGNYTFNSTASTTADITGKVLTVSAAGINKVYDGNTTATVTLSDDKTAGDDVSEAYASAAFDTKNTGTGKPVSVTGITISGADAGNYTFNSTASTTADITGKVLTVSAAGINKVYDGNTTATVTLSDDKTAGDDVSEAYASAAFDTKNIGTGKPVSVTGITISGADAGNYTFNSTASTTADITGKVLTVSAAGINKVYDGNTTATVNLSDNRVSGDDISTAYASAAFDTKNTGTGKPVSVTGITISGADAGNYTFNSTASTTADITGKVLTVSAAGINKVYDGNTNATVTLSDDKTAGDDVSEAYASAAFDTKNIGTGKPVSVTGITISGADAGNYTFNSTASTTADITGKVLTVSAAGINKVYDGNTTATVTLSDDKTAGDDVSEAYASAAFDTKNIGTGKPVSITGITISGADAGNYTFNSTASTTADITGKVLTVSAAGINKVYDGNTTATVNLSDNRVSGDDISTAYASAAFDTKNTGTGKPVSVTGITISGADAGNYTFNSTASTTADITGKVLTVSAAGINKVYDGNTNATVTLSDDKTAGDDVSEAYASAAFDTKNTGTGKPVSVTGITISGADAGNYTFNSTASTTADITGKVLTVSAAGINKVYDGNTTATVNLSDNRVSGDDISTAYASAAFDTKNIGTGKPVSVTGITISGADAGNYTFNSTASTTADITGKVLTVSAAGINKVYDGNTNATVTLSDDKTAGDDVSEAYASAAFDTKNTGTGKPVSVTGITISGADAGNYTFNSTASTTADITGKVLTVSAAGINKVYDGNTNATVTLSDDKTAGDDVSEAYASAAFDTKNIGTGKPVSVTGITISGADAGNYTFNSTASTTADITGKVLTVSAAGINKVYDGNTTATVNLSDNRVSGDDISTAYASAAFDTKNTGTGKPVSVTGITISGADAGNYTFNSTASTTADITGKVLTVSAAGINKVYDGNTTATVTLSDDKTAGDDVSEAYASAAFDTKNTGTGKPVSVTGITISGADAGNYTFNSTASTTADITGKVLTVSAAGINKVYDGNTTATVTLSDDKTAGDDVSEAYASAAFDTKNIGTGKPVSVTGITISGADAGNYTFNSTASTTADITGKVLTVSAAGINKVYDGNTTATVNLSDNRVSGDDISTAYASAAFDTKNTGTGKPVSVTGITISGADAGNYTFNSTASTTADITGKVLTVSAAGINKVYDGNTTATVTLSDDKTAGDDVSEAYASAAFDTKNTGTGKPVSVTGITISGADAGNYTFNSTASTTADITGKVLIVSAAGINKVYDGNTTATVTLSDDKTAGDDVSEAYASAAFDTKNIGTGKPVSVTGITISGADAGNYTFNSTASTTADITGKVLTVSAAGINKVYDGNTTATVNLSDNRVSGDDISTAYASAAFDTKNTGTGKPVSVTGITISGADAGNYTFNSTASTTADITGKVLTVSAAGINKVYDGNTNATVTLSDDKTAGDDVSEAYASAAFDTKNTGTGKPVSVTGITISGADAGNYTFNSTASTTADITGKVLIITADNQNKAYGAALPALTASYAGFVGGDSPSSLTVQPAVTTIADQTSAVGSYSINAVGAVDANYTISYAPGTLTIGSVVLTITADNKVKFYGSVNPILTIGYSGFVNGDDIASLTTIPSASTTATTTSSVGTYPISVSGAADPNYTFNYVSGTLTINAVPLTFGPIASQVYGTSDFDPGATSAASINYTSSNSAVATIVSGKIHIVAPGSTIITANNGSTIVTQSLAVTPASLTIKANNQSKTYGSANPALTLSFTGFVNGETAANLTTQATVGTTATASSAVGTYPITVNGAADANYTITYVNGTLTVGQAELTVTASDQSKIYGTANPALTVSISGFVNGDTQASLTTQPTAATTAVTGSAVGTYAITASGAVDANYLISYVPGTLTVTPAVLTITATNQTRVYGAANPAFPVTYNGFVNGDTQASLTTAATASTTATPLSAAGTYAITPAGAVDANYTFNYVAGTLTVTPVGLVITANNQNKNYGAALPTLTLSFSGFVNGDTQSSLTTQPTVVTTATANSPVGSYPITVSGAIDPNYTITYGPGVLSVNQANLVITPDNASRNYGAANPALSASYSGFANGDTPVNLTTLPTLSTTATASSPIGTYLITATGAVDPNYNITYNTGNLTVTPATLTITANNLSKTYGTANPTLTVSYSGFVNGETRSSLTTRPAIATTATTASPAGNYPITASGAVDPNYTFVYVQGTLTVNPAALTVTANDKSKNYGAANPALNVSYSGFVNGDTQASMTTQATATTTATAASAAGSYAITPAGAVNPNYTITYISGTLTINPASLTIVANTLAKTYGAPLPTLTVSYSGFVNGDTQASLIAPAIVSTAAVSSSPVGNYPINVSGAFNPNYTINYLPGTLIVTQVALFISADNQTKVAGSVNPTLTASYSGFVNGDTQASLTTAPALSTTATTSSPAGNYPISIGGAVDPNYSIAYANGTLTISNTSLSFAAIPAKTYGTADFDPGASSASAISYTSSNPAVATIIAGNIHIIGVGNSVITANAGSSSATQLLIVNPAPLTLAANNVTKTYGAALSGGAGSTAFTAFGLVNSETITGVTITYGSGAAASASVGTYSGSVTPSAATGSGTFNANNYSITYNKGDIMVQPVALSITANNLSRNYGSANPALTLSYSGFVNGDTQASLTTAPTAATTAATNSPVGTYPINVSGAASANYNITYNTGTLTVGQAALVISADNHAKTYGSVNPALTITYSGFVSGETEANLTTLPAITTTAVTGSPVGNYPIAVSGAVGANYSISYTAGTLTIAPAALTITADNQTKIYGAANPALTVSYSGFVNGDTKAGLTALANASTSATLGSAVGSYPISVSGAAGGNYSFIYNAGTLTVTPAALTITANNQSKTQGSVNPPLTLSYSGYVNGDTQASLATPPTVTTTAVTSSPVGGYPITVSGALDPDYTISFVQGTLTVTGSPLSFGPIASKAYGTADFGPGATSSSSVTYASSNPAVATIVSGNIHIVGAGTSTITANDGTTSLNQTLTVTPVALAITASNQSKTYGAANPALTASFSGFVNGDTQANLTTQPTVTTTAVTGSPVGSYPITASGAASANYTISYTAGTLTVGQAALTITADNQSKTQGAVNPALTVHYTGFVNGDTQANLTTAPAVATTAVTGSPVGSYAITASGAASANYAISYVQGTLTVTGASLSFGPLPSKVYGEADFSPGATGGTITYTSSNTAVATIVGGNIHIVGAGTSAITANNGSTSLQQTLTVTPGSLIITANNQSKTYGAVNPALTVSYSGFVNGNTAANLTTQPTVATTAVTGSAAGTYPISVSGAAGANYTITYAAGTLTVGKAALTITANNQSKVQGAANPALTVSYSGFVNSDTQTSLTTQPTVATTAATGSPVGTYPITASGAASANYNFTYVAGTLTVTAGNTLTFAAIPSKVYGTADFNPGATTTGGTITYTSSNTAVATIVSGNIHIVSVGSSSITASNGTTSLSQTLTVTPAALSITANNVNKTYGATLSGGAGSLAFTSVGLVSGQTIGSVTIAYGTGSAPAAAVATYSGSVTPSAATGGSFNAANYTITYNSGNIVVGRAALTITANNQSKLQGAANPALTASYSGFVNGQTNTALTTQPTLATTAVTGSPVGTYPITASGAAAANYAITYVQGTLTVTAGSTLTFAPIPSKVYGVADFAPGATTTTGTITYTSSNAAVATIVSGNIHIVGVGTSTITASNGTSSLQQTLTVTPATLTIYAYDINKNYGSPLTGASGLPYFTPNGLKYGQTIGTITIAFGTGAALTAPVGTYASQVTVSAATGGTFTPANYNITYVKGAIIVNKKVLTITAANKSKTQGTANPALTVTYSGFANSETNTVLTTQPTVTTTATTSSPAGNYPITASGAAAANYSFTYVGGTLTVNTLLAGGLKASDNPGTTSVNAPEIAASMPMIENEPVVRQAVSPNGDGINDVLTIENIENYPDNKVMLMNRNGLTIYEMAGYDNVNKVFDGHSNVTKAMQQPGTYFYMIEYKVKGEVKRKTGYFIIKY